MNPSLRYAGPAVIVLWVIEVVAVICAALVALDSVGPSTAMTIVLVGIFQYYIAIGFVFAIASMGIASHFFTFNGVEIQRVDGRSIIRLHAFVLLTALAFGLAVVACLISVADSSSMMTVWRFILLLFGALTVALVTYATARALLRLPAALVRFSLRVFITALAIGTAAAALSDFRVEFLQRGTLLAVDRIVHLLYPNAICDLTQNAVGTSVFRVRVYPGCSGVESMTLGALLVSVYLFLLRRHLRFPRALLLVPVLLSALAAVNVGRIVVFIMIGQYASQKALDGFHSATGWLAFALTIAVVIPTTESWLSLRLQGAEPTEGASPPNAAAPYLMPFIASLLVAAVISVLALDATPFAYLRYGVAVTTVLWFRTRLGDFRLSSGLLPIIAGALVAMLYVVSSPQNAAPSAFVAAAFEGSNPIKIVLYIVGYAFVTPLVEELAFRGYLLRRLLSHAFLEVPFESVGWSAILISSLAFGAMHGLFLQAAIAGLVFGFVACKTGGIRGAFVAHAVANGLLATYAAMTHRLGVIG